MPWKILNQRPATPGRLCALADTLTALGGVAKQEVLSELLQPAIDGKRDAQAFPIVLKEAGNMHLVEDKDGSVQFHPTVPETLKRREHAPLLFSRLLLDARAPDAVNVRVSEVAAAVFGLDERVLGLEPAALLAEVNACLKLHDEGALNKDKWTTWRTWAHFLGLGWTHGSTFVPNPADRIARELSAVFEGTRRLPAVEFLTRLARRCPELDGGAVLARVHPERSPQQATFALSTALRILHDRQAVKLIAFGEAAGSVALTRVDSHAVTSLFAEIELKEKAA